MAVPDIPNDIPRLVRGPVLLAPLTRSEEADLEHMLPDATRGLLGTRSREERPGSLAAQVLQAGIHALPPWGIHDRTPARLVGVCGFSAWHLVHARAELAFAAGPSARSAILLAEALREAIRYGFMTLGLNRIESFPIAGNVTISNAAREAGMAHEALLRGYARNGSAWHDVNLFAIIRGEWSG